MVLILTKVSAGHCNFLRVLMTPFDQCLKKTIKKFHDETDLTARIDKVCQSGATLNFPKIWGVHESASIIQFLFYIYKVSKT